MKINKLKVFICILLILGLMATAVYIVYAQNHENMQSDINVKYEKVKMITNFRLGVSNYDNINPIITRNKDILQIDYLIFEPLLEITEDYRIKNCLAKEVARVSNTSYVIKLKENVTWQDGTSFTAEDVKFTIEKIQKDKSPIYIENVKQIKDVQVVDNYTIRLNLNNEVSFFEYQLIFPIISKKQFENIEMTKSKEIPLGTGRYKITSINKDCIELEKNENWHDIEKDEPYINKISILIFETMGEVYKNFKLGNIDLVNTNNVNYEEYIGSMGYNKKKYAGREYTYIAFNCKNSVLKYSDVRKAIQKVINKEEIVSSSLNNKVYVSNFPLDYGNYAISDLDVTIMHNKEEASKTLKDNKWKYEHGIWSKEIDERTRTLNFNLIVNKENEQRVKVAELIKEQLENFGIKITIKKLSEEDYKKALESHDYEMILTGVYNSYSPELNSFLGEGNLAEYDNEDIKEILKELDTIKDEEILKEKYKNIIEICKDEAPYIGLYRNEVTTVYRKSVMGDVEPNNFSVFYNFNSWYRQ